MCLAMFASIMVADSLIPWFITLSGCHFVSNLPPLLAPKIKKPRESTSFVAVHAAHIRGVAGSIPVTATNPLNNATEASCLTTRNHPRVASDTG
jgi:hypothetical protein